MPWIESEASMEGEIGITKSSGKSSCVQSLDKLYIYAKLLTVPAMAMAKVGGPLSVVQVLAQN